MPQSLKKQAFTLVELLVVIGIIAVLISILLPSLNKAREQGNIVKCASNIRQLALAVTNYATENKGKYPPNVNSPAIEWYHRDRIGKYLPNSVVTPSGNIAGPIMVCPTTRDENVIRTYSMNVWASSISDQFVYNKTPDPRTFTGLTYNPNPPFRGQMWGASSKGSSQLILLGERFVNSEYNGQLYASSTLGFQGDKPGQRFLGIPGYALTVLPAGAGTANTEMDFTRHRQSKDKGAGNAARGRTNIAFADGHVELLAHDELADPNTGLSRNRALWSPYDYKINN